MDRMRGPPCVKGAVSRRLTGGLSDNPSASHALGTSPYTGETFLLFFKICVIIPSAQLLYG